MLSVVTCTSCDKSHDSETPMYLNDRGLLKSGASGNMAGKSLVKTKVPL